MTIRHLPILLAAVLASPAQAWTTESLAITGGSMTMHNATDTFGSVSVVPGPSSTLDDGMINGTVDADGVHGSSVNPVTTFMFLGIPWKTFFAHSMQTPWTCDPDCTLTVSDPEPGSVTVSGTAWDPLITADFSGFFTEWNGNIFRQGGQASGTGTWIVEPTPESTSGLYNFSLQWSAYHDFGPFQGFTSDWVLTGTAVAVVPEPETWAMLLAGLGLVAAAARRNASSRPR